VTDSYKWFVEAFLFMQIIAGVSLSAPAYKSEIQTHMQKEIVACGCNEQVSGNELNNLQSRVNQNVVICLL